MTDHSTRSRLWERPDHKPSKLLDEPVVPCTPITVNDLRGCDALLEKLQKVHGKEGMNE